LLFISTHWLRWIGNCGNIDCHREWINGLITHNSWSFSSDQIIVNWNDLGMCDLGIDQKICRGIFVRFESFSWSFRESRPESKYFELGELKIISSFHWFTSWFTSTFWQSH
jgi:hypothetical protein